MLAEVQSIEDWKKLAARMLMLLRKHPAEYEEYFAVIEKAKEKTGLTDDDLKLKPGELAELREACKKAGYVKKAKTLKMGRGHYSRALETVVQYEKRIAALAAALQAGEIKEEDLNLDEETLQMVRMAIS